MYFGKPEEYAIAEYIVETNNSRKEKLFNETIYPALNKLAENVIHNRKFYNYGEDEYVNIKHDCVVHLHSRLSKFNPEKGCSAFSYFNRVAINWVFANMRRVSDEINEKGSLEEVDLRRNVVNEVALIDYQEELRDFCQKWSIWGNSNLDHFYFEKDNRIVPFVQRDKQIANAIFDLFAKCEWIDIYNKKALYIMIREQVNVKTQSITDVCNMLKPLQKQMYRDFLKTGTETWENYPIRKISNEQRHSSVHERQPRNRHSRTLVQENL